MNRQNIFLSFDFILLVAWIPMASIISVLAEAESWLTLLLFFGVPAVYLSLRNRRFVLKSLFFSVISLPPVFVILDYVASINNIWLVPELFIPARFLGAVAIDDAIWFLVAVYIVVILYKSQHETAGERKIDLKALAGYLSLVIILIAIFLYLFSFHHGLLVHDSQYLYLSLGGLLLLLPLAPILIRRLWLIKKGFAVMVYFLSLNIFYELIATRLRNWVFEGVYILPPLEIIGGKVPIEEFFFVGIVAPYLAIGVYELLTKTR